MFSFSQLLRTPQRARTMWLWALGMWCAIPFFQAYYYFTCLRRHYYPTDGDSIGIPIFETLIGVIVLTPLFIGFVYFVLRRYPGCVPLAQPLSGKLIKKAVISLFFIPGIILISEAFLEYFIEIMPLLVVYVLAWFILWVTLWAVTFAKIQRKAELAAPRD